MGSSKLLLEVWRCDRGIALGWSRRGMVKHGGPAATRTSAIKCRAGFFMENSLSDLKEPLIPFPGTESDDCDK
jgi:hypothetical protein